MTSLTIPETPQSPSLTLFNALDKINDPRKKRGVRHNFQAILRLVLLGFTARLVCLEHIVEFASGCWVQIKEPLGFSRNTPPDATTIGRVLKQVDRLELEEAFRQWVSTKVRGI